MSCPKCRSLDTEMTGEIRTPDGNFEWVCNDCGFQYYPEPGLFEGVRQR